MILPLHLWVGCKQAMVVSFVRWFIGCLIVLTQCLTAIERLPRVVGGDGFYLPGAPGKVLLSPESLRASIAAEKYDASFAEGDILRYQLEKIFLDDSATATKIKGSAGPQFLNAVADFYSTRAEVQVSAAAKDADEKQAAAFRAAIRE